MNTSRVIQYKWKRRYDNQCQRLFILIRLLSPPFAFSIFWHGHPCAYRSYLFAADRVFFLPFCSSSDHAWPIFPSPWTLLRVTQNIWCCSSFSLSLPISIPHRDRLKQHHSDIELGSGCDHQCLIILVHCHFLCPYFTALVSVKLSRVQWLFLQATIYPLPSFLLIWGFLLFFKECAKASPRPLIQAPSPLQSAHHTPG